MWCSGCVSVLTWCDVFELLSWCSCGELTWIVLILFSISLQSPPNILFPIFHQPHSKYTCRHLLTFIYIPSVSDVLTPHVLSEWMVEVCAGDKYRVGLCLCFVLVLGYLGFERLGY